MGDLPYVHSSEQGGLIIRTELIYQLPNKRHNYTTEEGAGWAYWGEPERAPH